MCVFEGEYALGQGFGVVVGENGAMGLKKMIAVIVVVIDSVDGDAGFGFLGGEYGGVDVEAIHSLSAKLGQ